jgi:predicted nucleic acid-binding protein
MERVFADTGYWIALLNPRDDLHHMATAVARDHGLGQISSFLIMEEERLASALTHDRHFA